MERMNYQLTAISLHQITPAQVAGFATVVGHGTIGLLQETSQGLITQSPSIGSSSEPRCLSRGLENEPCKIDWLQIQADLMFSFPRTQRLNDLE